MTLGTYEDGAFTWLQSIDDESTGGGSRLFLRTTEKEEELARWLKERGTSHRAFKTPTIAENLVGKYADAVSSPVRHTWKVNGQLVRTNRLVRSNGRRRYDFPMTLPHRRLLVSRDQEQWVREWCAAHGFADVVADRRQVLDLNSLMTEVDGAPSQHSLVVYSCFRARIWPASADAYMGNGDIDGAPVRRFPLNCGAGSVLVKGRGEFGGYAGIRFPEDTGGEREFRRLIDKAAFWLAEYQTRYGGDDTSDWRGWSDDKARAYTVALFQDVLKCLQSSPVVPSVIAGGSTVSKKIGDAENRL